MPPAYAEYRCSNCRKLLFRGILVESEIEIKCRSCHELTMVKVASRDDLLCAIRGCPYRVAPIV